MFPSRKTNFKCPHMSSSSIKKSFPPTPQLNPNKRSSFKKAFKDPFDDHKPKPKKNEVPSFEEVGPKPKAKAKPRKKESQDGYYHSDEDKSLPSGSRTSTPSGHQRSLRYESDNEDLKDGEEEEEGSFMA